MKQEQNLTMLCDFYEFTMANGYFETGYYKKKVYFDVFFRTVPDGGGFAIAAGLEQLYTDEALRQKLREAGPKRAAQFTWERSAEQLYAVYQEACRE